MTSKYYVILTAIGAAKLANATALGAQLEITHMAIGDGGGVVPNPDATQIKLVNECYRAQLNSLSVDENNQNQIIAEMVLPETIGGWYIRETGLYDSVGDLIAVANAPESYKPQLQEGSGRTQVVRMVLIVSSTSNVSLKIDPAIVLATRQHVDQSISALEMRMKTALTDHEKSRCHPDATLSSKGFVKLSKSTDSDNDTTAATSSSIKAVSDQVSGKLSKAANLSDVEDVALVLENLGLTEQHFGYQNIQTYTDAGIYTFNVPDELCAGRKCWVEVYGGGGGRWRYKNFINPDRCHCCPGWRWWWWICRKINRFNGY
ncbi:phage tail protein [Budvicia aquatica]|uniref:Phage tail fibre repeat n=1 Tax=Budvicia aquatica TaxID=82979 RepID=A0A484ZG34_9GAMM|nr:phage tail protein [Budvicia aquatica]VFS47462.1 Phage tail fibre repeat [Budvicia aquatica]